MSRIDVTRIAHYYEVLNLLTTPKTPLTMIMYDEKNASILDVTPGQIAEIHLIAKNKISKIDEAIHLSKERNVEISNKDLDLARAAVTLSTKEIIKNSFEAKIAYVSTGSKLMINSPESKDFVIRVLSIQGQIINQKSVHLEKGYTEIPLSTTEYKGIQIVNIDNGKQNSSLKFIQ